MTRPTKHPRTGIYRLRKAVPIAFRSAAGCREWLESLGTREWLEAKERAPAALARIDTRHAAATAKATGTAPSLSARDIAAVVGRWRSMAVAEAEACPGSGASREARLDDLYGKLTGEHGDGIEDHRQYLPDDAALTEAADVLDSFGIAGHPETVREVAVGLFSAKVEVEHLAIRRLAGDWSDDRDAAKYPQAVSIPASVVEERPTQTARQVSTSALLAAWAEERKPAAATLRKYAVTFGHLRRVLGHDDVLRICPADVVSFKAARLKDGKTPKTVADDVLAASAVCRWGARNLLLPNNPFAGLAPRVSHRGPTARDPYNDEDAARILLAARAETGWLRWLPWLLCFTGARIGEIAEMRREDVRQDGDMWALDIRPLELRAGKNETFQRLLPVHPAIQAEGFLAYALAIPPGPLFPDMPVAASGGRTARVTEAHARWLRETVGITDPRLAPAHSWRHRMEDSMRRARVPAEVQDAISGRHNPRNAGAGYGKGYRGMPDEVLKELAKIPSPLPAQG